MRRIIGLLTVFILVFSTITVSAQIEINPPSMNVDLIGGQTVTKQITITWHGETPTVGFIYTEIEPDGEGFNVTYSENPVVLYPDTPKTLDMNISVAINIMPFNYTLTTVVYTDIEQVVEIEYNESIVEVENTTRIDELLDIIQVLYDKLNQTTNYSECLPLLTALQESIDELHNLTIYEGEETFIFYLYDWTPFIIFVVINVIILSIAYAYIFRLLKQIKEKKKADEKQRPPDNV